MEPVTYEVTDHVGWVTLNRPSRLNAMSKELMDALREAAERAAADDESRVVVLTGAGRAFTVGGDLSDGAGGGVADGDLDAAVDRMRGYMRAAQLLAEMPKVTIAMINGACAGAGLALACACDFRFAGASAVFSTAFLTAGLPGDYGGTWTLSRIVGTARARELYLLPDRLTSAQAADYGLVTSVAPDAELAAHVDTVVQRLLAHPPVALREMKRNLNDALGLTFDELLNREARRQVECARTVDASEAARAFMEKRQPTFVGR